MKKLFIFLFVFVFLIVSLNVFIFYMNNKLDNIVWSNTFFEGENISELSFKDVENKIKENEKKQLEMIKTITYGEKINEVQLKDLNTTTNSEEIINHIKNQQEGNFFTTYLKYLKIKDLKKEYFLELNYDEDTIFRYLKDNFEETVIKEGNVDYSLKDNAIEVNYTNKIVVDYNRTIEDFKIKQEQIEISTMEELPVIDKEVITNYFEKNAKKLETKPTNASLKFENGNLIVVNGYNGKTVDVDKTILKINSSLKNGETLIPIVFKETSPEVTAEDLQAKIGNINVLLGSFTTSYASSASGRKHNVELASDKINGKVLAPNETFSYNSTIGYISSSTGWQTATVFSGGKAVPGIGGGVCQVSSTLYNAVLYSNLEIVERHNHGLPVGYVKPSLDATVASGSGLDFKFKNSSDGYIYIRSKYSGGKLTVEIYGEKKDFEVELTSKTLSTIAPETVRIQDSKLEAGTEKVVESGSSGYVSEAYIKVTKNGTVIKNERLSKDTYRATKREIHYN